MKRGLTFLIIFFVLAVSGSTQNTIKFMTYNLLNFTESSSNRTSQFKTVIDFVNPDILVVQEMISQTSLNLFYNQVLNDEWSIGTFIDGPDSDNAVFYKNELFNFAGNTAIPTALRNISQFTMIYRPTGDTLLIYSVHLKSSTGGSNEAQRAVEVNILRGVTNSLPVGTNFLVCGDFNIYKSTEQAYIKLITDNGSNDGHFVDPIQMTGTWNNIVYSPYHTQSPRIRQFGGGANGGLDDRFDMILYSQAISDPGKVEFVDNSLWAVGNDGNHYNDSINRFPNTSVPPVVANALHNASDHLPVIALFRFENHTTTEIFEITLKAGWNGISAWLEPVNTDIASVMSSLGNSLVLLENFGEVYWPANGINTIVNWQINQGYQIKVNDDTTLIFEAKTPTGLQLQIEQGWNLIPVPLSVPIPVGTFFGDEIGHVQIIKEASGNLIYWPEQGVFTLQYLQPRKAYLLKSDESFTIAY